MWLKTLHALGFTNLSNKQVQLYEEQKIKEKAIKQKQTGKQKETIKIIPERRFSFGFLVRNFALTFFLILIVSIVIVTAFTQGWLTIMVGPRPVGNSPHPINNNEPVDDNDEFINENFIRNPSFTLIKHPVEPVETLIDLEKKYGTSWKVIQKINKINDPLRLQAGKIILVPIRIVDH